MLLQIGDRLNNLPIRTKYNSNLNLITFKTVSTVRTRQKLVTLMKSGEVQNLTFRRKLRKESKRNVWFIEEIVLN
jgi:hypothetical protein